MKRADMVRYGAQTLFEMENAIDLALNRSANLIGELTQMRLEANVSAVVGQDAMSSAAAVVNKLTEAREAMVLTHKTLDVVKDQLGCRTVAVGTGMGKPEQGTGDGSSDTATGHADQTGVAA